jgi:hypothetical protein
VDSSGTRIGRILTTFRHTYCSAYPTEETRLADKYTYDESAADHSGGKTLRLEVGSRDGHVFIGLRHQGGESGGRLKCLVEPKAAEQIIAALAEALKDASPR